MHVVMLTNAIAPDKIGGLERYVRELSIHLVKAGCGVTVIAKRVDQEHAPDETGFDGVRILRHDAPSKRDPSFALRYPLIVTAAVRKALRGHESETILHGHFPVPTLAPALRRARYVYTLHAPVYRELLSEHQGSYALPRPLQRVAVGGLRAAEALVVARASRVITLSEFMRSEVRQLSAKAGDNTRVIAGGIDTDEFQPGSFPAESWSADAYPLLFTARRLVPHTGVLQLVQAMPQILARQPNAKLAVAGSGLQQPVIEAAIAALGLQNSVRLLGRVDQPFLGHWYRRAHLVVTPSQQHEGFGLVTAEALASGRPCLVTPSGANPEVASLLSPDLVANGNSPADLAEAVCRLSKSPAYLSDLANRARAAVYPAMSWPNIVDRHLALYAELG
ncbi:MAG: glycosyltransferase [Frankiales bacterium]|nr:glycosyltransferase [Frankiales bacterium]